MPFTFTPTYLGIAGGKSPLSLILWCGGSQEAPEALPLLGHYQYPHASPTGPGRPQVFTPGSTQLTET